MTLLASVVSILNDRGVPYALIGAGAMAVHGVARSTLDMDILVTDSSILDERVWEPVRQSGAAIDIRRGDPEDPLAGVARLEKSDDRSLDLIVGRFEWQRRAIERASRVLLAEIDLPVVTAVDLILLKLFAGGPQDAWDIEQLLAAGDRATLVADVDRQVSELPADSIGLWRRFLS